MFRKLAFSILIAFPMLTNAQLNSEFNFNGQNVEIVKSEKKITIVTPEQVEVPDTCVRQIPVGEAEVCRNETRYREECSWIPTTKLLDGRSESL